MASRDPEDKSPLAPDDDVMRAIHLLEWGRRKGVRIGPILEVGDVKMQVNDIRQLGVEKLGGKSGPVDMGPYAEQGLDPDDVPEPGTMG